MADEHAVKGLGGGDYNDAEREAIEAAQKRGYEAGREAVRRAMTKVLEGMFDVVAATTICGVMSNSGRYGEPLACALPPGHTVPHSWASLPTFGSGGCIVEEI